MTLAGGLYILVVGTTNKVTRTCSVEPPSVTHPIESSGARSVDRVVSTLSSRTRRLVLTYLEEAEGGTTSLADLAGYIGTHQGGSEEPETVRARLHHIDLPALQAVDLVHYDAEKKEVRHRRPPEESDVAAWVDLAIDQAAS